MSSRPRSLVEHDLFGRPVSTFLDHTLMPARHVRVGRSATGLGLFATRAIARGAPIVSYRGPRIPTREAHERERRFGAKYMFELNRRWSIDGSPRWNLGRYANHSCQPNAEPVARKGRVKLVAAADLAGRGNHLRLRRRVFRAVLQKVRLSVRRLPRDG